MSKRSRLQYAQSERAASIRQLEALIMQGAHQLQQALRENDDQQFQHTIRLWTQAQSHWLQETQQMSAEQAGDIMASFFMGPFTTWLDAMAEQPLPTVLSLYPHP